MGGIFSSIRIIVLFIWQAWLIMKVIVNSLLAVSMFSLVKMLAKFFTLIVGFALLTVSQYSFASQTPKSHIDSAYLPITPAKLKAKIVTNRNNEIELVQLLRRGYQQNEVSVGYKTLKQWIFRYIFTILWRLLDIPKTTNLVSTITG